MPVADLNPTDSAVIVRGRFSGKAFALLETVLEEEKLLGKNIIPIKMLNGKTLKGGFTWEYISPKPEDFTNRPNGTYLLMIFPKNEDIFQLKTFVFR